MKNLISHVHCRVHITRESNEMFIQGSNWQESIYRYQISIVDISTLLKNIDIDIVIFENINKAILKQIDHKNTDK